MASAVATPLERQFTSIAGLDSMISNSGQGCTQITLQFDLSRDIDGADGGRGNGHRRGHAAAAAGHADAALLPQGEPRRFAHHRLLLTSPTMRLSRSGRVRRDHDGAAHLHGRRRGPGAGLRRAEVRRARAGGPQQAGRPPDRPQRGRRRHPQLERQHSHRHAVRPRPGLQHPGQRPVDARRGLPAADRRLQQRRRRCGWTTWRACIDSVEDDKNVSRRSTAANTAKRAPRASA